MCRPMFLNKQLTCSLQLFYIQFVTNESDNSAFLACNIHHRSNTAIYLLYFVIMEKMDVLFMNRLRCHSKSSRGSTRSKWLFKSGIVEPASTTTGLQQNLPLPPKIHPSFFNKFICAALSESTPPSQSIPSFSTTICDRTRTYLSLSEYTPLFNNCERSY